MLPRFTALLLFFFISTLCLPQPANKPSFKTSTQSGFIENKGQIIDQDNKPNPAVLYLLNTPGMNVQLRRGGFSYDLYRISNIDQRISNYEVMDSVTRHVLCVTNGSGKKPAFRVEYHRIDFDLLNANPNVTIETSAPSSDYLNYYTTGTPTEGITSVRSFNAITYKDIYAGIDLQFIVDKDGLFEYNFILQPGADIASIKLKVSGPEKIKKYKDGIYLETTIGVVEETIPVCYYTLKDNRVPAKGKFKKISDHLYGFAVDKIVPAEAVLFIDPIPTRRWGTYYGSSNIWNGSCVTDNIGNVIIAGSTGDLIHIATAGAYQTVMEGNGDAFLAKFSTTGQRIWGTYYGGDSSDDGASCSVDKNGNIFLAGSTSSTNNIASLGAYQTFMRGNWDSFVAKFTSAGMRIWGTYYGGNQIYPPGWDYFYYCATDTLGNVYCAGQTSSPDFISTPGAVQPNYAGNGDGFLVKFTGDGQCSWGTYYGGSSEEQNISCTVSKNGFVYISGNTGSSNNIATPGSFIPAYPGFPTSFLACFNLDGQRLWGTYFGGNTSAFSHGCTADTGSNVYFYGFTNSNTNIATPGTYQTVKSAGDNGYLEKFSSEGARLWGTYYGISLPWGGAVDDSGFVYLAGKAQDLDPLIFSPGAYQTVFRGVEDAILAKFSGNGQLFWGTYYGGTDEDEGMSCAVDHMDNIYLCGYTLSVNNTSNKGPCTRSPYDNIIASSDGLYTEYIWFEDGFLVKFADCWSPDTALQINGPSSLCVNSSGIVFSIAPIATATDYTWCVTGDLTITAGQHTTSITVNIGSTLGIDTISVYGINACDTGFPKVITRRVYQRPVPQVTGSDTTCTGSVNLFTTVGEKNNYQWTFSPGGILVAGGTFTDSSCTITWSNGGAQWVRLNYIDTTGCNALAPTQFDVWVIAGPPVSVSISSSMNPACIGTSVTYTATGVNDGSSPVYQWKVNGLNAGTNSTSFNYTPNDGDIITCILTSNIACGSDNPATSNAITMIVYPILPVSVSISVSENPVCQGTSVIFTATPTNGGSNPTYQWLVNGSGGWPPATTFIYTPVNGDCITCSLTSNVTCPDVNPAISNMICMTITTGLPVSVSISASENPFCQGSSVTFTATPTNGGSSPVYQWKVNGLNTGANNMVFTYFPVNGDCITCTLTSNLPCATGNPAISNAICLTATPILPVSVVINASVNPVCTGTQVTFTATATNGGSSPVYQWKLNGINLGTNNMVFTYTPVNGDCITCLLTSSLACATGNPATSNIICLTVNPNLPVSISITASANPVCSGTQVIFTANPGNPGTSPVFQWKVNGINVGSNSLIYFYIPVSGDQVSCILTSNAICPTGNPAASNTITMTVNPTMSVSVTVTASANPVCSGTMVTYTAIPTNGGSSPVFQWYINGISVGSNNPTYQYIPNNGDLVTCTLTSNLTCTTGNPATSNTITMSVASSLIVTFTRCNDSITTINAQPFRLKGGIPLGGTYLGPGVTNGIFYPAIAGIGTKIITYTYTNTALCSANANLQFLIPSSSFLICGTNLTDIRDNKVYPTVQIGSQCWMAANLNHGTMIPGNTSQRDNCTPEKYCYNDVTANCGLQTYYQWDELMQYDETVSTQGFCPPGWHVPTETDWNTLFAVYINNAFAAWPLLSTGYSGFNATLSGTRHLNKTWDWYGFATFFWSSTSHGVNKAWAHGMNYTDPSVSVDPALRSNGFSVRCIKD